MQKIRIIAVLCALLPLGALAQVNTPRVDQRQANQEARIEQGVQSGSLTPREANRLERRQQRIEQMETRAKADGTVTAQERARLHQAQGVENRDIRRQKHDRQHDFNHDGRADHRRAPR